MATETFLGRVFEKHGITDWEEMIGGKDDFGKMCALCPQIEECKVKSQRCEGKSIILLMASSAIVKSGLFPVMFADVLRDTVAMMSRLKEARDKE